MLLRRAVRSFLESRRLRCTDGTIQNYASQLKLLSEWLSSERVTWLAQIKPHHLKAYVSSLLTRPQRRRKGTLSAVTIQKRVLALKTFFRWCCKSRLLKRDPAKGLAAPDAVRLPKTLTRPQIECFLRATETERERAVIFLLLDTGMRLGELAALEVGDLDLAGCTARIRHGKGDKERHVCFIEKTQRALTVWLANRWALEGETALFTTSHGTRWAAGGLYKLVVRVGRRAGVKVSPHMLRHTFATEYLNRGGHIHVLQKLLGHTTLTMTLRYTEVALEQAQLDHRRFSPLALPSPGKWRIM